jgi:uncharacterized membrane protein YphA (DoxX/SURF4 family)
MRLFASVRRRIRLSNPALGGQLETQALRTNECVKHPPLWVVSARLVLGLVFLSSGLAKLVPHFPNLIGPVWLEERLAPYGLALFARFIALSEVFAGSLLLMRRFATLGALTLLPILSCMKLTRFRGHCHPSG